MRRVYRSCGYCQGKAVKHVLCPQCGASVAVPPSPSRKAFGRTGGNARASKLTPERRQQIAKDAAVKRWDAVRAAKA